MAAATSIATPDVTYLATFFIGKTSITKLNKMKVVQYSFFTSTVVTLSLIAVEHGCKAN